LVCLLLLGIALYQPLFSDKLVVENDSLSKPIAGQDPQPYKFPAGQVDLPVFPVQDQAEIENNLSEISHDVDSGIEPAAGRMLDEQMQQHTVLVEMEEPEEVVEEMAVDEEGVSDTADVEQKPADEYSENEPEPPAVDVKPEEKIVVIEEEPQELSDIHSVHVGMYRTRAESDKIVSDLQKLGYPSFWYPQRGSSNNGFHVVVAGKYVGYELARAASQKLRRLGYSSFVSEARDSLQYGPEPSETVKLQRDASVQVNRISD